MERLAKQDVFQTDTIYSCMLLLGGGENLQHRGKVMYFQRSPLMGFPNEFKHHL